jgi:chromosome partitioning protein
MRVISIANQKGGVGKTTVSLHLAEGLARRGYRVLMIDMDPQFNLSYFYLGEKIVDWEQRNIGHVLLNKIEPEEIIVPVKENLYLMPSYLNLSVSEIELISSYNRERRLRKALEKLHDGFDYVIIDNPPSLGIFLVNSLVASDYVIVPLEPAYFSIVGMELILNLIDFIKSEINNRLKLMGAVFNRFSRQTKISSIKLEEFRQKYPNIKILGILPSSVMFEKSHSARKTIYEIAEKRNLKVVRALEKFIDEVIKNAERVVQ